MIVDRVKTLAAGLSLTMVVACGYNEEMANTAAVRDRSRVLGLAKMTDGTYQFRLCRPHKSYTATVLEEDCINPFVDREGMPKVFTSVPARPGTATAHIRNWILSLLAATIAGAGLYKLGRLFVKERVSGRLIGEVRVAMSETRLNRARGAGDLELSKKLKRATEDEDILISRNEDDFDLSGYSTLFDFDTGYRQPLIESLQEVSEQLSKKKSFSDIADKLSNTEFQVLLEGISTKLNALLDVQEIEFIGSLKGVEGEIEKIIAGIKGLRSTTGAEFSQNLQNVTKDLDDVIVRLQDTEGIKLSDAVKADLIEKEGTWSSAFAKEFSNIQDPDMQEIMKNSKSFRTALAALKDWKRTHDELASFEEVKKLMLKNRLGNREKTKSMIKLDDIARKYDPQDGQARKSISELEAELKNGGDEEELNERLHMFSASYKEETESLGRDIKKIVNKKASGEEESIKTDTEGTIAGIMEKIGNRIKKLTTIVKDFPYISGNTFKYGKFNKMTVVEEKEVVRKIAGGEKLENIEVPGGLEKLIGQATGAMSFLALPLTELSSRYLPGYTRIEVAKNWQEATGDHSTIIRVEDLQAILDGIAFTVDARVSDAVHVFGR